MKYVSSRRISVAMAITLIAAIIASSGAVVTVQAAGPVPHDVIRVGSDVELAALISAEGWSGSGTSGDPYIIENLDINADGFGAAIYIGNTTLHVIVRNCELYGAEDFSSIYGMGAGLLLYHAENARAEDNECRSNRHAGIHLSNSGDCVIVNNECSDNNYGIYLHHSSGNTVEGNDCDDNILYGIETYGSNDNVIESNVFRDSKAGGGIRLSFSKRNAVVNNSLINNSDYGIAVDWECSHNSFHGNVFMDNGRSPQARDDGVNGWNSSAYGNYWSDRTSPDMDRDGIVDEPYEITGAGNLDRYPMAVRSFEVEITSPADGAQLGSPMALVTGTGTPGYPVEVNGFLVKVRENGTFAAVIALPEGDSVIKARSASYLAEALPEASSSVTVTYVDQASEDIADLLEQVRQLQEENSGLQNDLDGVRSELNDTKVLLNSTRTGLQSDLDDVIANLTALEEELNEAQDEIATQKDTGDTEGDPLPLILGAVGLLAGLAAIAFVFVHSRRPQAP